jgi:hypothetical protein
MPGAAGNDFSNNQLINVRLQAADESDVDVDDRFIRYGLPTVSGGGGGKIVYAGNTEGAWDGVGGRVKVCTDPDPDPAVNGGGTWSVVQFGEPNLGSVTCAQSAAVTVAADLAPLLLLHQTRRASGDNGWCICTLNLNIGSAGTASNVIQVFVDAATGLELASGSTTYDQQAGSFTLIRSGSVVTGTVIVKANSSPVEMNFYRYDGSELGSVVTLAATDTLLISAAFIYTRVVVA